MDSLGILFPVLNEQIRLEKGIVNTVTFLDDKLKCDYEIWIVDNGSTDQTSEISEKLCQRFVHVHYIKTEERGVGLAFRTGVSNNTCDIVGYMDVDLSTDIRHLEDVLNIFQDNPLVQIVNASRLNKKSLTSGRKWYRNITSHGLTCLLHVFLGMKASDSICGFKFFKKEVAETLILQSGDDNGWFYIIELLIRAERKGFNIVELPVRWEDDYNTKVKVFKLIRYYIFQILKLRKKLKQEER